MTVGGIGVTTSVPVGAGLFQPAPLAHWLPAIVLGLLTLLVVNHWKSPFVLAGIFVLAGLAFFLSHAFIALSAGWPLALTLLASRPDPAIIPAFSF